MTKINLKLLAAYVTRVMHEKSLSSYDVARLSDESISQSYINRIKNGAVMTPSLVKLEALGKGLREPVSAVIEAAGLVQPTDRQLTHERLLALEEAYARLHPSLRAKFDYLLRAIEREISSLLESREEVPNEDLER
jgi:transcriptional regulator with XRE-family HTH domain